MTDYAVNNRINQVFGPVPIKNVSKSNAGGSWSEVYRQAENNAGLTDRGLVKGDLADGNVQLASLNVNTPEKYTVSGNFSAGTEYIKEPKRSDFNTEEEFYAADNRYVQALLENPNALPELGKTFKLTRPGGPGSRSTDVYERKIEDDMIKYLGSDGRVLWQVFVPSLNWHKSNKESEDPVIGEVYSRNLSRYAAETIIKRGSQAGQANPVLPGGEQHNLVNAYLRSQHELYGKYGKMHGYIGSLAGRYTDN